MQNVLIVEQLAHMQAQQAQNDQVIVTILNPLTANLFKLNFHPLEVVSRLRDPQLQVSENSSDLTK